MKDLHNQDVEKIHQDLLRRAELANKAAASERELKNYSSAEDWDRSAEALRCADVLLTTRGFR